VEDLQEEEGEEEGLRVQVAQNQEQQLEQQVQEQKVHSVVLLLSTVLVELEELEIRIMLEQLGHRIQEMVREGVELPLEPMKMVRRVVLGL